MAASPRLIVVASLCAAPLLLLTSCGGAATEARRTLVPVQPSSYVVQEPVTTTTTTTTLPTQGTSGAGQISPTEQAYEIRPNDNLSKIANLFDIAMEDICSYNEWSDCVDPPHLLLPGETIRIPPNALVPGSGGGTDPGNTGSGGTTPDAGTTADTEPSGEGCSYTIEPNDNPSKVAEKFGIDVGALQAANPPEVMASFLVGATLVIPAGADC